jgi:hypothetical protein
MKFSIEKRALVHMLKTVNHRDRATAEHRKKNEWLRIEATFGKVELMANGVGMGHEADVLETGVCFVRYRGLLELVQSFKADEINMAITPEGMRIESWSNNTAAFAIFDIPATAPATLEDVSKPDAAEPSFISPDAIQHWREMVLRSKRKTGRKNGR